MVYYATGKQNILNIYYTGFVPSLMGVGDGVLPSAADAT
jgi:hypothetical protein